MNAKTIKGYLMIFTSAIGFGSYGVWSKFIGNDFGVFFQGWVRSAIVLLILLPITIASKSFKRVDKKDVMWLMAPVLFGVFTQAPLYYAYNHADIGTATLIFYATYVITSYIIGKLFIGEQIGKVKLISLLLAFIGLFLVFGFSLFKFSFFALILASLNGIASGGEVATTKKSTEKYSSLQVSTYVWLGIFLTHLPMSLITGETQIPISFNYVWLSMLAFAGVGLISFWLVVEGYRYVDASIGGLLGLFEIIFGVLFGIIIFKESATATTLVGGILILASAMLPNLSEISSRRLAARKL